MKNYSIYILILSFVSIIPFTSCGDDEIKGVVRFVDSNIESYCIYVGSESGGQELHPDSIKNRFDEIFPSSLFEDNTNTSISFLDETNLLIEQTGYPREVSNYTFEDGSLYIYNKDNAIYYGDGNKEDLTIRQHYIAYKQFGDKTFISNQISPQKNITKEDVARQSPFLTIENMKSKEDTLVWCTRRSFFR